MKRLLALILSLIAGVGCSAVLDFDNEKDLPCPCLTGYVCLTSSNRCVLKNSVDDYKSCSPDAENPDDLCKPNSICYAINANGPQCLPKCVPSNYATPEAGLTIGNQCQSSKTCWAIPQGGGVCSDGLCSETPNSCDPPQQCVAFNSAGICFTPCPIFKPETGCIGDQACHPIGSSSVMACVKSGNVLEGQQCDDTKPCAKLTAGMPQRPLVCDRPAASTDVRRCRKICQFGSNLGCDTGEECQFSRPNADPDAPGVALGLCVPKGT
ncbi:MAG: hypothetical protein U1E65_11855 [Myxococcota bacterium]